jgi:hypothetical protein
MTVPQTSAVSFSGPTLAFLSLRLWLGLRALIAGVEKFSARVTIQEPLLGADGAPDPSGAIVEIEKKVYGLSHYHALPDTLTTIGQSAFGYCSSLTSVTIPASVIVISSNAFRDATKLKTVYFLGDAPAAGANVFTNTAAAATAYYRAASSGWNSSFAGLPTATFAVPPDAPTGLVAVSGSSQVALSWVQPTYDGGAAITNYLIQYSTTGGDPWTPVTRAASAATTAIQACPSAVRRPTRMPGVAAGSSTFTSRSGPLRKPKASASSINSRSTPRIAPCAAKKTIQNTPMEMMNTAAA